MSQPRAPEPNLDPPLDLAALVWDTATAFTASAEPEPDDAESFADGFGSVGAPLECFGMTERE